MLRFNVFGKLIGVEHSGFYWKTYWLGSEGKYRDAEFVIPDNIKEDELPKYLADIFHEAASIDNSVVFQIK